MFRFAQTPTIRLTLFALLFSACSSGPTKEQPLPEKPSTSPAPADPAINDLNPANITPFSLWEYGDTLLLDSFVLSTGNSYMRQLIDSSEQNIITSLNVYAYGISPDSYNVIAINTFSVNPSGITNLNNAYQLFSYQPTITITDSEENKITDGIGCLGLAPANSDFGASSITSEIAAGENDVSTFNITYYDNSNGVNECTGQEVPISYEWKMTDNNIKYYEVEDYSLSTSGDNKYRIGVKYDMPDKLIFEGATCTTIKGYDPVDFSTLTQMQVIGAWNLDTSLVKDGKLEVKFLLKYFYELENFAITFNNNGSQQCDRKILVAYDDDALETYSPTVDIVALTNLSLCN